MHFLYLSPFGAFGLSHVGPFVPIAATLRDRGHQVAFGSLERSGALERLGFECHSQAELGLPAERLDLIPPTVYLDGSLDDAFARLPADRVVVDGAIGFLCLYLAKLGRPSTRFQITLPLDERPRGWSPITAPRQIRATNPATRALVAGQWLRLGLARRLLSARIAISARRRRRSPPWISGLDFHRRLAAAAGLDPALVHHRGVLPGFPWPEVVACDVELGLGYPPSPTRAYAGNLVVDWRSEDPGFDWTRLRPATASLVYCSFGSNSGAWEGLGPLLRSLVEASRRLPGWDFVVAAAERWRRELGDDLPPNLHAVEFAPQLELLARADVFVTHGGMSSIREARHHGVPMFVVPIAYDQFGNAARVVHLGLGEAAATNPPPSPRQWEAILVRLAGRRAEGKAGPAIEPARTRAAREAAADFLESPSSAPVP